MPENRYGDAVESVPTFFREAERQINAAIEARDFEKRERLVLELVRNRSWGKNQLDAYIPHLGRRRYGYFAAALKISEGNACSIVGQLILKEVIERPEEDIYAFRFPIENWKVPWRAAEFEVMRQLDLIARPPCLHSALRLTFLEECGLQAGAGIPMPGVLPAVGTSHTTGPNARADTQTEVRFIPAGPRFSGHLMEQNGDAVESVPTKTGAFPNREREASPGKSGGIDRVPESGTGTNINNVEEAPSEHVCNVALVGVPKSGTGLGLLNVTERPHPGPLPQEREKDCNIVRSASEKRNKSRALSAEEQRIFDQLGALGAFGTHGESRGCWFEFVKSRPFVTERLMGELNYARSTRTIYSSGAFMMDLWKRWGRPDR